MNRISKTSSALRTVAKRSSSNRLSSPSHFERYGAGTHFRGGGKPTKRSGPTANTSVKKNQVRGRRAKKSIWDDEEALINNQDSPLYEAENRDKILAVINHPAASALVANTPLPSLSTDEIRHAIEHFQNDGSVGLHDAPFLAEAAEASKRRRNGDFEAFEEAQFIEQWCNADSAEEYSDDDYEEPKSKSTADNLSDFEFNFDIDRPSSDLSDFEFDMDEPEPDTFSTRDPAEVASGDGEVQGQTESDEADQNSPLGVPETTQPEGPETPQPGDSSKVSSEDDKDEPFNSYANGSASPNGFQSNAESEDHNDV